jgi:hypothetical protein
MRPPRPFPTELPFLTIYTPTFRRPQGLAKLLESVARQTARERLEHIVVPDHAGLGLVGGLFRRIAWYAPMLRGRYVSVVCDDDVLAADDVVERIEKFAAAKGDPEVIVVRDIKQGLDLPSCAVGRGGPPEIGEVDLTNYVVRADVFRRHAGDYGLRYEGDFDHGKALYDAGYRHEFCDVLYVDGALSNGRPEVDWH